MATLSPFRAHVDVLVAREPPPEIKLAPRVRSNGAMARSRNPFRELERLFEQMQENLEEAGRWWQTEAIPAEADVTSSVDVDLEDAGDELVLTAELPGFDRDDIDVRVDDDTVHLAADRETEATRTEGEFVRRERHRASVERAIPLPASVHATEVSATFENGLLTVRLPKTEPASEGTEIEIA
jgi:HSP20 family protein